MWVSGTSRWIGVGWAMPGMPRPVLGGYGDKAGVTFVADALPPALVPLGPAPFRAAAPFFFAALSFLVSAAAAFFSFCFWAMISSGCPGER